LFERLVVRPFCFGAFVACHAQIKAEIEETTSDYDREKLQERLPSLPAVWR
jgi:hypothetical protein